MSNFDPIRDCPHGRQKGKCDSCDLEQAEKIIEQQQQRINELEEQLKELVKYNQISQLIGEKNTFRRVSAMSLEGWLKRKMNSEIARVNRRIEEIKKEKEDE